MASSPHVPPARLVRNDVGIYAYVVGTDPSRLDLLVINALAKEAELDEVCARLGASGLIQGGVRRKNYLFSVRVKDGESWDDQVKGERPRWEAVAALIPSVLGWEPDFLMNMGAR